jgi:two-component system alkaline phosphatase synthesis response regulator PhoP
MESRILLIEDDHGLRLTLSDRLESEGYRVETAADGEEGAIRAVESTFDLVVLDAMLPGKSGFEVCRDLRQRGMQSPVLMLSACGEVADRVRGLTLGADDYVTKPFEMTELLARVEARLRVRSPSALARPVYRFGSVEVDLRRTEVCRDGAPVALSAKEFKLLRHFIGHRGATIGRNELLNEVWGKDAMPGTRTVDVHVAWLRRKLEPNRRHPRFILTVHGRGYKFAG